MIGIWSDYSYEIYLFGDLFQEVTKIGFVRILGVPALANLPVSLAVGLLCPVLLSRYVIRKNRFLRRFAAGD